MPLVAGRGAWPLGFAGVLLDYLARVLVDSQSSKLCMAQVVRIRPLRNFWLDPTRSTKTRRPFSVYQ
jgi:hypothetical protein